MYGVGTEITVKYLKEKKEKTGTIKAFKYIGLYAELYLDNGDCIMEQEVIEEINNKHD